MSARHVIYRIATHAVALAVGWAVVRAISGNLSAAGSTVVEALPTRTDRRPAEISGAELLDAYRDSEVSHEMIIRRYQPQPPAPVDRSRPKSPEERAAEATDITGDLETELAKVQAGTTYDYQYAKALISRWMEEDPDACSLWLGRMNSAVGWGDPFVAFARSRPPLELLDLMENGWLGINRSRALNQIAETLAAESADVLTAFLDRLEIPEREGFLENAVRHAKAGDAALWLEAAGTDIGLVRSLAQTWIEAPRTGGDDAWMDQAEAVLAAAQDTPAEEILRARYDEQLLAFRTQAALARAASDPAAAFSEVEAVFMERGETPEEARKQAAAMFGGTHGNVLHGWKRSEWDQALQSAVFGMRPVGDVLADRLMAIERELPPVLQQQSSKQVWRDAMAVDPATTVALAISRGQSDLATDIARELANTSETSFAIKAELLRALAAEGLWTDNRNLPSPEDFASRYYHDAPEGAQAWRKSLPAEMARSLEEVMR